ncbi:PIN domain nuclease, a component of toxin-antitoxin system (PIN domain) [Modestobacter sp. DSM 44400]|uniref:type II toxin-antitoxin system VapC family toxin n=1 Tax=Modestobacter sp. DSM 44400 TaxID=1550230 RepID=UPI000898207A|nr:type II toxin-antitoxin system VapC family toxin [Modestobacter sp. DSM 44400]SDY68238.1 PIN domain nuclease, a component of toxin-antitoxin system (PIN domain) [Modestobacter sp. DSM 44400]
MRLLLDTHVLLWAASTPGRLGSAQQLLLDAEERLLSAASSWELAIKRSLGKLELGTDVRSWVARAAEELQLQRLSVTHEHAAAVEHLPPVHRDPFDRLLIAQAWSEGAVLLTADRALVRYGDVVRLVG